MLHVVDTNTCHLLLDRLLQFDVNVIHRGRDNVYEFRQNSKNVRLVPLTNKKKKYKAEEKKFLDIVKGHLEDDCDGYKKMQKENDFKEKTILDEVQPLLVEFTDITPLKMPNGLSPL